MSASFREPKSNDGHSKSAVFACVWEKKVGLGRNDYMYMIIRIWTHAHSHMYTHTHTHMHKNTHAYKRAHSLSYIHIHSFFALSLSDTHMQLMIKALADLCIAVCGSVLQCVAVCCRVLQGIAGCCSVLQCVAVCCSVLQCLTIEALFNVDWSSRPPTESGNRQCREKRRWVVILMEIARNIYRR